MHFPLSFLRQYFRSSWPVAIVIGCFVLSRLIYIYGLDTPFIAGTIYTYWQYLDIDLLRNDLLRSVFYLHQQPPLFNLYLGITVKLFPTQFPVVFHAMYLLMGLAFAITQLRLMQELGVKDSLATVLTVLAVTLPTRLLYESWLFYTYPIAFLMCLSALYLIRFLKHPSFWRGSAFFGLLATLILTRSIFQLPWMLVFLAILLCYYKPQRALIIKAAALPLLVVLAFSVKQYLVFGHWTLGHSMIAPNLVARITPFAPAKERNELLKEGSVPPYFFLGAFRHVAFYAPYFPTQPITGIPALDREGKGANKERARNFNNTIYLALSDGYIQGIRHVMLTHPQWYLRSFKVTGRYFNPAADDMMDSGRFKNIIPLQQAINRFLLWQPADKQPAYMLVFGLPVLLAYGLTLCLQGLQAGSLSPAARIRHVAMLYIVLNILYITAITTSISMMDFARYRMKVDAFYLALFAILLSALLEHVQKRRSQKAGKAPATRL